MNIINLHDEVRRFSYETIKIKEYNKNNGEDEIKHLTVIVIKYIKNGNEFSKIHPITEFVLDWSKYRPTTMKIKAVYLSTFLNYIVFQRPRGIKLDSLYDLKFEHAKEYLNEFGKRVGKDTVKTCEKILKKFFYFMSSKGFLRHYEPGSIKKVAETKTGNIITDIEFTGLEYPEHKHLDKLKDLPITQMIPFIEAAWKFTPQIVLGVYFQIFGGLRVGEVVNISRTSISRKGVTGRNGLSIKLKRRNFRLDLKNINSGGGVKKPRTQYIFPDKDELIVKILKFHLEKYEAKDGSNALFVDKNGNAMTDSTYRKIFNKLKKKYIDMLLSDKSAAVRNEALRMQSMSWSTHLGRGIFSNMIAEATGNIALVAKLRGDNSYVSALTYLVGTERARNSINELNSKMYDDMKALVLSKKGGVIL